MQLINVIHYNTNNYQGYFPEYEYNKKHIVNNGWWTFLLNRCMVELQLLNVRYSKMSKYIHNYTHLG